MKLDSTIWEKAAGACLIAIMVLGVMAMVGRQDFEDALAEERVYCEMYQLWLDTRGEAGAPDYRGNAAEICED